LSILNETDSQLRVQDYDFRASGITRQSFCSVYHEWIVYCAKRRAGSDAGTPDVPEHGKDSMLVTLCFALSLLGRRALGAASHNFLTSVEFFLGPILRNSISAENFSASYFGHFSTQKQQI
jgi:hypothetical protein